MSTTPLYSNRSSNSACNNIQNQINKQSIMPMYNVKGVQINNCDDRSSQDKPTSSSYVISHTSSDTNDTTIANDIPLLGCCCAISLYCLCFS